MGYFTIKLPNNKKGDVRYGPIKKMKRLSHRFRRKNFEAEQMAYIVTVNEGYGNDRMYYLLKSKEGQWIDEMLNELFREIKTAIDKVESRFVS